MSGDPYRHERTSPENDAALQRLAAEGRRRAQAGAEAEAVRAATGQRQAEETRERNIRVQLGAYYGTPFRKASFWLLGLGVLLIVFGLVDHIAAGARNENNIASGISFAAGIVVTTTASLVLTLARPAASAARVAAERAWASSLPFAMHGYFEMLGDKPVDACRLELDIAWLSGSPAEDMLLGILGNWDPAARLELREAMACVQGNPFVCGSEVQGGGDGSWSYVRPDRHLVERVHRLVDLVLLPVHQSYAIDTVSLRQKPVDRNTLS